MSNLEHAIYANDLQQIQALLSQGESPYLADSVGWSTFACAIERRKWDVVRLLLRHYPRQRLTDHAAKLILMQQPPIPLFSQLFNLVEDVPNIRFDPFLSTSPPDSCLTHFITYCYDEDTSLLYKQNVIEYLLSQGLDINETTAGGYNAFQCSLRYEDPSISLFLLKKGADFPTRLCLYIKQHGSENIQQRRYENLIKLRDYYNLVVLCSGIFVRRLGLNSAWSRLMTVDLVRVLSVYLHN